MKNRKPLNRFSIVISTILLAFLAVSCMPAKETSASMEVSDNAATVSALWTAGPIPPLRTPYPPPTRRATITSMPSNTHLAKIRLPAALFPTSTRVVIVTKVSNTTTVFQSQPQTSCSIYARAKAQYKDNLAYYKAYYAPMIQLYQSWVDQDVNNRDALALVKDTEKLNAQKNALSAAIADQKKQYNAVVPKECR